MSDMRIPPNGDGPWIELSRAKDEGIVVTLLEDHLGDQEPPLHRATARAVEAALVISGNRPMPGVLLADGTVLVLSWEQSFALVKALKEFTRVIDPELLDALGPARATVALS